MESKIKLATIKNIKDIQKLNLMLFEKEYKEYDKTLNRKWPYTSNGKKYFKKCIVEDDSCVLIASVNNKIVGYLIGGIHKKGSHRILPKFAELENMYVLDNFRSKGIGSSSDSMFPIITYSSPTLLTGKTLVQIISAILILRFLYCFPNYYPMLILDDIIKLNIVQHSF